MKKIILLLTLFILISGFSFSQLSSNALHFDGVDDYVSVSSIPGPIGDFTFEAWIRDEASSSSFSIEEIFSFFYPFQPSLGNLEIRIYNGHLDFGISSTSPTCGFQVASADLRDNQCHHIAITRQSGNMYVYIDSTFYNPSVYCWDNLSLTSQLYIGASFPDQTFPYYPFNGIIKEVRLWDVARTQSDILSNMNTVVSYSSPGLVSYWRCNEGSGLMVTDYTLGNNGTFGSFSSNPSWAIACPTCTLPTATITAGGSTTFCSGSSVTLNANTGSGWSYQWQLNGVNIAGATSSTYNTGVPGYYTCVVSNTCGNVTSNLIIVTTIPTSDTIGVVGSATICNGSAASLNAGDAGSGGTYQWQLNGTDITGATGTSYAASVQGSYTCSITNSCGTFLSNAINIVVSGTCLTGLQFDGVNDYVKIPNNGAYAFGTGNFTIEAWVNLDVNQQFNYPPLLSNRSPSSFNSGFEAYFYSGRPAILLAGSANAVSPVNIADHICHHIAFTRSGILVTIYVDGNVVLSYNYTAYNVTTPDSLFISNDVAYGTFTKGKVMEVRMWNVARTQTEIRTVMNTILNGNETGLVGYWRLNDGSGQIVHDYSLTANDGQLGPTSSADSNDPLFSPACALSGCVLPTSLITASGSTTICSGDSVTLNANTGTGLSYQWQLNGTNVSLATSTSYPASVAGNYTCVVTNGCGNSISNSISVAVRATPAGTIAANGTTTFCTGGTVLLTANATSGVSYQWQRNGNTIAGAVYPSYYASVQGNYTCSFTNVCGTVTSNGIAVTVLTACSTGLYFDGINDFVKIPSGGNYAFGSGNFTIEAWIKLDAVQPNISATIVSKSVTSYTGFTIDTYNNYLAVTLGNSTDFYSIDLRDNLCHHIAVSRRNTFLTMYIDGVSHGFNFDSSNVTTSADLFIGSFTGNGAFCKGNIMEVRLWNIGRTQSEIQSTMNTTLIGNETGLAGYWRLDDGSGQVAHDYSLTANNGQLGYTSSADTSDPAFAPACQLSACTLPAASVTASGSTTFCSGDSVVLDANTGTGLSFQWQLNAVNIPGATSSSYSADTTGSYACVVTNACGSTTSNSIPVTLHFPPTASIIGNGSTTICPGDSVQLDANTGAGLSYQWQLNGVDISGAISSIYTATDTGHYSCVETNSCGSSLSDTITLFQGAPVPSRPGHISGTNRPCPGATGIAYSIFPVSGATSYLWKVPATATISSGQGTIHITVDFSPAFSFGGISVTAINDCGNSAARGKRLIDLGHCHVMAKSAAAVENIFEAEIYPNPTSDHFTLRIISPDNSKCMLIIKDLLGRELERRENISAGEPIDFGFYLSNGIYFAEVIQGNERKVLRLIRNE
ncbi:MAG: T9SS type A sorting domain-containing protein [Bacteroidetes bacterium]|nr:T9SS type A sorting domain-containing protein [Bacteroidota bacterium]